MILISFLAKYAKNYSVAFWIVLISSHVNASEWISGENAIVNNHSLYVETRGDIQLYKLLENSTGNLSLLDLGKISVPELLATLGGCPTSLNTQGASFITSEDWLARNFVAYTLDLNNGWSISKIENKSFFHADNSWGNYWISPCEAIGYSKIKLEEFNSPKTSNLSHYRFNDSSGWTATENVIPSYYDYFVFDRKNNKLSWQQQVESYSDSYHNYERSYNRAAQEWDGSITTLADTKSVPYSYPVKPDIAIQAESYYPGYQAVPAKAISCCSSSDYSITNSGFVLLQRYSGLPADGCILADISKFPNITTISNTSTECPGRYYIDDKRNVFLGLEVEVSGCGDRLGVELKRIDGVTQEVSESVLACLSNAEPETYFGGKVVHFWGAQGVVWVDAAKSIASIGVEKFDLQTSIPTVDLASLPESREITVTGNSQPVKLSVQNGEYRINDGIWTNLEVLVNSGVRVRVRHSQPPQFDNLKTTVLSIGDKSANYTTVTRSNTADAGDITPDAFKFTSLVSNGPNELVTSDEITVTGISNYAPISITEGEYSVNDGAFISTPGFVLNGQRVRIRNRAPMSLGATLVSTLTIGNVSETFTVTTPAIFNGWTDEAPDALPNSLANPARVENAQLNQEIRSEILPVSGIEKEPAQVRIEGGEYSINGGAFSDNIGQVRNGDTVEIRHFASSNYNSQTVTTVYVGSVPFAQISSLTLQADYDPDPFTVTGGRKGRELSTTVDSDPIRITGISNGTPISVEGGQYSINGGEFTSTAGSINSGDIIVLRQITANSLNTKTETILKVGIATASFANVTKGDASAGLSTSGEVVSGGSGGGGSFSLPFILALPLLARRRSHKVANG